MIEIRANRRSGAVRVAATLTTVLTAFGPAAASDYYHVCRTADGVYEMNDLVLARTGDADSRQIEYRIASERTIRREKGYCTANSAPGQRYGYESRTYFLDAKFSDGGREIEATFLCELAADGLPASYQCDKQTVELREGDDPSAAPGNDDADAGGATAQAPSRPSTWMHNGSVIRLEADGDGRRLTYHKPRTGMRKAGAVEGSLLFEGKRLGDRYEGVAFIFAAGCKPEPYDVTGVVSDDDRKITLIGRAPRIGRDCSVTGTVADTLIFSYRPDLAK